MRRTTTLLRLATRGVLREARRSLLTASAMALGLALLMFTRSLADGGHEDWIDAGVRMGAGHIQVQAPGFRESRSLDDRLSGSQASKALAALTKLDGLMAPVAALKQRLRKILMLCIAPSASKQLSCTFVTSLL